jgi:hypothetical protein
MTLHLRPETQAKLAAIAAAHGLSADDYLEVLVERELIIESSEALPKESASGMVVEESGLRVYRTGKPIPVSLVDSAIRRSREERSRQILGDLR